MSRILCLVLGGAWCQRIAWSRGVVCSGGAWSQGVPGLGGSATGGWVAWSWGVPGPGGCLVENTPGRLLLRAVRILLECILVDRCEHIFAFSPTTPSFEHYICQNDICNNNLHQNNIIICLLALEPSKIYLKTLFSSNECC